MTTGDRAAWNAFWAYAGARTGAGCLPSGSPALERAQRASWESFAPRIGGNGRVLDIATGDGRVMAWLLACRRDLAPTGIDFAEKLPPPPSGASVRCGISMEDLPFPAGTFDAVVSQFGFEYGDIPGTAAEIARVLAPGGIVGLMTHRGDSVILMHNRARRDAISWAIEREDLPGIAKRSLALRSAGIAALPPAISTAPARGQAMFGANSAAWEIAEAIRRTLELGRNDMTGRVAASIDTIAVMAKGEMGRIAALERACAAASNEDALVSALGAAGLEQIEMTPVREAAGARPFADFRLIRSK
ncbi:class I SAM-dependent methyltransferase [Pelagerythrobacter sp.]|uniref:class I SAM-dependent methyltransferase n=1 Tax=Pelagerythrobacter sp. TaxID=2800702 RepID=UPI0035B1CCD6